jgi:aspartyl-tRNA(Asn)/glutamyl-tRNA(Gln) amidotransferase subunit B
VRPAALAELLTLVKNGRLTTSRGREVLECMIAGGKSAEEAMQSLGIVEVAGDELESLCRELLEANPKILADLKEGKTKAAGALIGMAKKKNPNVNANRFREVCAAVVAKL